MDHRDSAGGNVCEDLCRQQNQHFTWQGNSYASLGPMELVRIDFLYLEYILRPESEVD